jgi:uncharacterized protein YbbC (DUF1343 family)
MVTTGLDRLLGEGLHRSERIGLATNPSAVTRGGAPNWKALMEAGYAISAFFGPEHGFRGDAQDGVEVADGSFLGIPSYSLYGTRDTPEPRMLDGLDCVVYDIQDVGCRYYTYLYTLANIMAACEKTGTRVVVLDRPDPIGGIEVEGAPIAPEHSSFVGGYRLPHRYGMTVGEFALYLKGEYFPGTMLEVVELKGWKRSMFFEECGLPWVSPSPNIPSIATAMVYPGTCLFEGTELSEGRGTTRPFETLGAPWIDGEALRAAMAAQKLPGVTFTRAAFTPTFSKHKGVFCEGVTLHVADRAAFRPLLAGIALLKTIRDLYPKDFAWKPTWEDAKVSFNDRLAGGPALRNMIDGGQPLEAIYAALREGEDAFRATRAKYLIYS